MSATPPIICLAPRRWTEAPWSHGRLLTHLARAYPICLIEEPLPGPVAEPRLELRRLGGNLWLGRPHLRAGQMGFAGAAAELAPLLRRWLREHGAAAPILWLGTPTALPLATEIEARAIVYDRRGAEGPDLGPAAGTAAEAELLGSADLILTDSPAFQAAVRGSRRPVQLLPGLIDTGHFAAALSGAVAVDPATAAAPLPRLGYCGRVDERLDLDLLDALAAARPAWQLLMVGRVTLDPASLPRRPNIHWLGPVAHAAMPAHLAGWQVALLPLAQVPASAYLSPTTTLEYMAAGRPIVATPVPDVAGPHGHCVALAADPEAFIAACERSLAEDHLRRRRRLAAYAEVLGRSSAAAVAGQVAALLATALRERPPTPPAEPATIELTADY